MPSNEGGSLIVSGLEAGYGRTVVVRGVGLTVEAGSSLVIVGPNGAGKTTLLKALVGVLRTRAGTVTWNGTRIQKLSTGARARKGIAFVPDRDVVFSSMSVRENLRLGLDVVKRPSNASELAEVLDLFPALADRINQTAGTLSGGERRMLAIARAMASRPTLLVLDEPSAGLAVAIQRILRETVGALSQQGVATLIVEQNLQFASTLAGNAALMDRGSMRWTGACSELLHADEVEETIVGRGIAG